MENNTGYIYKIALKESVKCVQSSVYIGSSSKLANVRLKQHLAQYKRYKEGKPTSSYSLFTLWDIIDPSNFEVTLLETVEYTDKKDLHTREGFYIEQYGENCVNKNVSGRDQKEYRKLFKKEYNQYQRELYHKMIVDDEWKKTFNDRCKSHNKKYRDAKRAERIAAGEVIKPRGRPRLPEIDDTIEVKEVVLEVASGGPSIILSKNIEI